MNIPRNPGCVLDARRESGITGPKIAGPANDIPIPLLNYV